ncbi:MAG: hypothetical protein V2B18_04110 [Pseudomonadota bacterium]
MRIGDIIKLNGQKAEYSLFGRDRFSRCTLPDGHYVIVGFEDGYVGLAWSDTEGNVSRKHRYRIETSEVGSPLEN